MNVLVIPEDFRKDQYVLKPILAAILKAAGAPRAQVRVCQDPLLGGVEQALDWFNLEAILERYRGMVDLFVLVVDRDGIPGRRARLDRVEKKASGMAGKPALLGECAWQEIEVWILAGHRLPHGWDWQAIRDEPQAKETYYLPFAKERGVLDEPGEGRKTLALEAAGRYRRVRDKCPEDIGAMERRIAAIVHRNRA